VAGPIFAGGGARATLLAVPYENWARPSGTCIVGSTLPRAEARG